MSGNDRLKTDFAPAERATPEQIAADVKNFEALSAVDEMLDAVPDIFVIINEERQIVYANEAVFAMLGPETTEDDVYGRRLGEVLGCVHAAESDHGCGTTEFCSTCGAVRAMLQGLSGKTASYECRISMEDGDALDLRVWSRPLKTGERRYAMFTAKDIADEKRRRVLERTFFHDVMNTVTILSAAVELVSEAAVPFDDLQKDFNVAVSRLNDEIRSQQVLAEAESGDLTPSYDLIDPHRLVETIANTARRLPGAAGIDIKTAPGAPVEFYSDHVLLTRVLGNLVKNAIEASEPGDEVVLAYDPGSESITFSVHNPAYMARSVQLQIFQRSFSTKGSGRGIGTYSIKLLTEHYLNGEVWFESNRAGGTTFYAKYPLKPPQPPAPG